jgi:hypothetical protein
MDEENMPPPPGGAGGIEYSLKEGSEGGRGADDQGNSWFLDAVPQDSNLSGIPLRLLRMCDLMDEEVSSLFFSPSVLCFSYMTPGRTKF